MDIKDFKVGQTVYVKQGEDIEGRYIEKWVVTYVGEKCLRAKPCDCIVETEKTFIKSDIGNIISETLSPDYYIIYTDKQQISDEIEYMELSCFIEDVFRFHEKKLSLDQLRRIKVIMDESKEGRWNNE